MDETPIEPVTPVLTIDYRYRWLSETISKLLGISDRKFAENLLCDHSEKIRCYFDDAINDFADCNKRLLFIWRTFYDKLVEETISVLEEVAPATPPPDVIKKKTKGKGKKTKDVDVEEGSRPNSVAGSDDETEGKKGKGKGKKKKKISSRPQSPVYIEVQKIIQSYVKTPILHCHFGPLLSDSIDATVKYVYFLRKYPTQIANYDSYDECAIEMQKLFIIGSTDGQVVASLRRMVQQIYPIAFDTQYRHPTATNYNLFATQDSETNEHLDISRPSDYRIQNSNAGDANKSDPNVRKYFKEVIDPFADSIERIISSALVEFDLSGANIPSAEQENPTDDEANENKPIQPNVESIGNLTNAQLEELAKDWMHPMQKALVVFKQKQPNDDSPITEFELWQMQEIELKTLLEKMRHPFVVTVQNKLDGFGSVVGREFQALIDALDEKYRMANEITEYLSTIVDYLNKIREESNFDSIVSLIPNLMLGLRHIWTMSTHFCQDENMETLLYKISFVFTEKVKRIVTPRDIFKHSPNVAYELATQCANLLLMWKTNYLETRASIERADVGSRWEFNKSHLFDDIDHYSRISNDIANVSLVFIEFDNLFDKQLRRMIFNPDEVNDMLDKIYQLIDYIVNIDYDIFRPANLENWEASLKMFNKKLATIEDDAKFVIDQCIAALRSTDMGIKLIKNVDNINTRRCLIEHIQTKQNGIIKKFISEIEMVEHEFRENKMRPPLIRNQPNFIGAILWERLLCQYLNRSANAFRMIENDLRTKEEKDMKQFALQKYHNLIGEVNNFERIKYEQFLATGTKTVNKALKSNILKLEFANDSYAGADIALSTQPRAKKSKKPMKSNGAQSTAKRSTIDGRKLKFVHMALVLRWVANQTFFKNGKLDKIDDEHKLNANQIKLLTNAARPDNTQTWETLIGHSILIEFDLRFCTNFPYELYDIIMEGHHFECIGFELNPVIRMAIMRKETLFVDVESIAQMITVYNGIMNGLTTSEMHFLRNIIHSIELKIQAGLSRHSWQSMNINDYCQQCRSLIMGLQVSIMQMKDVSADIESHIAQIAAIEMLKFTNANSVHDNTIDSNAKRTKSVAFIDNVPLPPIEMYFSDIYANKKCQQKIINNLIESIGANLIKLESSILGTHTGQSSHMKLYYIYWEKKLLKSLIGMTQSNLNNFLNTLSDDATVFFIDATLSIPDIISRPTGIEVYNMIMQTVNDFLDSLKLFARWMTGTCLASQFNDDSQNDNPKQTQVIPFYDDIITAHSIYDAVISIQKRAQEIVAQIRCYLLSWNKYKSLWISDKTTICTKFVNIGLPLVRVDEKFLFYTNIVDCMDATKRCHDVGPVRINMSSLINSVRAHAIEWKITLGRILAEETEANIKHLRDQTNSLKRSLHRSITGFDDFKLVMHTIATIQSSTISTELRIHQMQETFNVFKDHKIKFEYSDMFMSYVLEKKWHQLFNSSLLRIEELQPMKRQFAEITAKQIDIFKLSLLAFVERFLAEGPGANGIDMDDGIMQIQHYTDQFELFERQRLEFVNAEKLFDMEFTDYADFLHAKKEFDGIIKILKLYEKQKTAITSWAKTQWTNLKPDLLLDAIEDIIQDFLQLEEWIQQLHVGQILFREMFQFKTAVPLMAKLKNDALRARHWRLLMEKTAHSFDMDSGRFEVGHMFAMSLYKHQIIVDEIVQTAANEVVIEITMNALITKWNEKKFTFRTHSKGNQCRSFTLIDIDPIVQMLEDDSMRLQVISMSAFLSPFYDLVHTWEQHLSLIFEIIDQWMNVTQRKWLYLEGIFIDGDARQILPDVAAHFDRIDTIYRQILDESAAEPSVMAVCMAPNRLNVFYQLNDGLEKCQKLLNEYLSSKRHVFPRFYFISKDELLSILGNGNPISIQAHIIKMFENMQSLLLEKGSDGTICVEGVVSTEGEVLRFKQAVSTNDLVENWLNNILTEMHKTYRFAIKKAIFDFGKHVHRTRNEWIEEHLGGVCLAAINVWYAAVMEETFWKLRNGQNDAMKMFLAHQNGQLNDLVAKVCSNLSNNERLKFRTITIAEVHARDIIDTFVVQHVMDANDFLWRSQLRFHWLKETDNLHIEHCSGHIDYGYEYFGLDGRLVVTPLTNKIHLAVTHALTMQLGCSMYGTTTGGKTETIRDLAKILAIFSLITNCNELTDFNSIETILSGLMQCGGWSCLTNFNNIAATTIDVISMLLHTLRASMHLTKSKFNFGPHEFNLDNKFGIFITINPVSCMQAEMSAFLKAHFRTVSCVQPDYELICSVSLFSDGFSTAKTLAKKVVALFRLASEQLTKHFHYDWGLRSLRSVLKLASQMRQMQPELSEAVILIRSLHEINLSKLVFEDVPLFLGIIKDLFPGIDCPHDVYSDLCDAIKCVLEAKTYRIVPYQQEKIIQLYKTLTMRHCTILIGSTGGGKSVIINTLIKAQQQMGLTTKLIVLNPKACSVAELYGYLDSNTDDWMDGLFANIFRDLNRPIEGEEHRYICLDGDIDPIWIENMNTVMDENKLLTLANGERIRLENYCSILFEVGNLEYASPATIARVGVVFVDAAELSIEPVWQRWLHQRNDNDQERLQRLFDKYITPCIERISNGAANDMNRKNLLKTVIHQTHLNMLTQFCCVFDALFPLASCSKYAKQYSDAAVECGFVDCLYKSFGAAFGASDAARFDAQIKRHMRKIAVDDTCDRPATCDECPCNKQTLFDYFYDLERNVWIAYDWIVPDYVHNSALKYSEIFVPTVDTIRISHILNRMINVKQPILVFGETATSKTATMRNYLKNLNIDSFKTVKIIFTSKTSSLDVQHAIESSIEKRTKDTFGPPLGKRLAVFIDNLNITKTDCYGTQQPIALLKLLFEKGGTFDRDKDLNWKYLKDILYYGVVTVPGGGQLQLDERFVSLCAVFNMMAPIEQTIFTVYQSILRGHLTDFATELLPISDKLIYSTHKLLQIGIKHLPPTPSKFHYTFNLKDLTKICYGMLMIHSSLFTLPKQLVRVWRNEFCRVICDRLMIEQDAELMMTFISAEIKESFATERNLNRSLTLRDLSETKSGAECDDIESDAVSIYRHALRDPLLFGDYRNMMNKCEPRYYEDLLDYEAIYFLFQEILQEYNETIGALTLTLFEEFLEHLTRVHRVLRMSGGHALLVGCEGCGKKSTAKLAAFAADCTFFEIVQRNGFDQKQMRKELQLLFHRIGIDKSKTTFMVHIAQLDEGTEHLLEIVNKIINVGVSDDLFTKAEKDEIIHDWRKSVIDSGSVSNRDVWNEFLENCNDNIHIVICTTPTDNFRSLCRLNHGLAGSVYINWMQPWSEKVLIKVANIFLAEHPNIPENYQETIIEHVVHVHESSCRYSREYLQKCNRINLFTPKHYIEFIHTYLKLIDESKRHIVGQCNQHAEAIAKIDEVSEQFDHLSVLSCEQQNDAKMLTNKCAELATNVEQLSVALEVKSIDVTTKQNQIVNMGKLIAIEKETIEDTITMALQPLNAAKLRLINLDRSELTDMLETDTPPEPIEIVGECFVILKGIRDVTWKTARSIMADENFFKSLMEMNCDVITLKQLSQCKNHIKKTDCSELGKVSMTFNEMFEYLKTILVYCDIVKEIKVKREHIRCQEMEMEQFINVLQVFSIERNKLQVDLADLRQQQTTELTEKMRIESLLRETEERLNASSELVFKLKPERSQWAIRLTMLENENERVVGNSLVSASFYTYLGGFSFRYRCEIIHNDWLLDIQMRKIPIESPFMPFNRNLSRSCNAQVNVDADDSITQNCILVSNAIRYPLCIDPYGKAIDYIKSKMVDDHSYKILHFYDEHIMDELASAISAGECVIFDDIDDSIDLSLRDLLEKNFISKNNESFVNILSRDVLYNSNFRMYFITRKSKPNFDPSIYSLVTVIDFDLNEDALEHELFSVTLMVLEPNLEMRHASTVHNRHLADEKMQMLEQKLLDVIASTDGSLLDNIEIMEQAHNTKSSIVILKTELIEMVRGIQSMEIDRHKYRLVVKKATSLFVALSEMAHVNAIYQYSLTGFIEIFANVMRQHVSDDEADASNQQSQICSALTKRIYDFGVIGLMNRDKILFSLQIAIKCELCDGHLKQDAINYLYNTSATIDLTASPIEWLTDDQWTKFIEFDRKFQNGIAHHCETNEQHWKRWHSSDNPESINVPGDFFQCDNIMQVMLVKCVRADRVYPAIRQYIALKLGSEFLEPPLVHFDNIFHKSSARQPIVVIRCDPIEPVHIIEKLSPNCRIVSFGRNQNGVNSPSITFSQINEFVANGQWLIICYNDTSWQLIKEICSLLATTENLNEDFRLWIIIEQTQRFPLDVLRTSFKVVCERPNSLREHMKKTFAELDSSHSIDLRKPPNSLLYVLGFFHAVIQERMKYGKIGWNIMYEFNEFDFDGSFNVLNSLIGNGTSVCWASIKYFFGEIIYGGRILDTFDKRLLHTYLDEYFGDFLFNQFHTFNFNNDENTACAIPMATTTFQQFSDATNKLPLDNVPSMLGLHENDNILYNIEKAAYIWRSLGNSQPSEKENVYADTNNHDEKIGMLAEELLVHLPKAFDIWSVKEMLQMKRCPTGIVLLQELQRYNALVDEIENTLKILQNAVAGKISMNETLEEIAISLFNNRVPECWKNLAPDTTMQLGSWLSHVQQRAQQYKSWSVSGEPTVMWLSGLHAPNSYLQAILQTDCRKNIWPIECTCLFTIVTKYCKSNQVEDRPDMGCFVTGLFIEGANWCIESNSLVNSKPNILVEALPILAIVPMEKRKIQTKNTIVVPVYSTVNRAGNGGHGFVFEAYLRNTDHASKWILRGVCLILNSDRQ